MKDDGDTTRKAALTYDALGRLIEVIKDVTDDTVRYYYGGNEMVGTDGSDNRSPPQPSIVVVGMAGSIGTRGSAPPSRSGF